MSYAANGTFTLMTACAAAVTAFPAARQLHVNRALHATAF
jgi:hypothetical protein